MKGDSEVGKNKEYLNPMKGSIRSSTTQSVSDNKQPVKERKIHRNKKHDIKVPVTESMDSIIREEASKRWGGSKTTVSTELVLFALDELFVFPDVEYCDGPLTVHVKVEHDDYMRIGQYAAKWKLSMRQATHRLFLEAYKKKQLGGLG